MGIAPVEHLSEPAKPPEGPSLKTRAFSSLLPSLLPTQNLNDIPCAVLNKRGAIC
jgi:hypothetical protein